jgi:hypothetical protein
MPISVAIARSLDPRAVTRVAIGIPAAVITRMSADSRHASKMVAGAFVQLSEDFVKYDDAANGPLRPGIVGKIVQVSFAFGTMSCPQPLPERVPRQYGLQ